MFDLLGRSPGFKPADAARLRRVESKLDLILNHLGITDVADEGELTDIARTLADEGDKIGAIKAYRAATGVDLVAAKQAVESYMTNRR